jgi:ArsR family transcriptional regulator, arsenate/arsenite/antimonite-responsive transcriptional repressor
MEGFLRVMKALSDPGRVAVLKLLAGRELCACEITGALGLAQPTVSRHMRVLSDAGLVAGRKVGAWVHYRLPEKSASPYARAMLRELSAWLDDDEDVLAMCARLEQGAKRSCQAAPEQELRP